MVEKKRHTFFGKVIIGIDEYRDLISNVAQLKEAVKENKLEYLCEFARAEEAEEKTRAQKLHLDRMIAFVNSSEEMRKAYRIYRSKQEGKNAFQNK